MKILFKKGLPGFENYKTFIIGEVEGNSKLKLINSTENEHIGFIAISPFDIKKDYEIKLDGETLKFLEIESPKDVILLNIITLGKTLEKSTVNLKAPLVINIRNNKGKQLILQDDKYAIKEPLTGVM